MADLQEIRMHIRDELTPSKKERGKYICPICGSGSHGPNSTAAFSIEKDNIHGHCFACGFHGDIFDLYAQRDGISPQEATRAAVDRYGAAERRQPAPATKTRGTAEAVEAPAHDFSADIQRFHEAIPGSAGETYLKGRGITPESIQRFSLGYDAQRRRVTIPYDRQGSYYDTRAIDAGAVMAHGNLKGVEVPLFNAADLYCGEPCFVVESALCAVSIAQVGGAAVAISGTAGVNRLKKQVTAKKPAAPLILSLDNDKPGQEAQGKIAAMLSAAGIPFIHGNVSGAEKDPNELLQRNPDALKDNVRSCLHNVAAVIEREKEQTKGNHQAKSAAGYLDQFFAMIEKGKTLPAISTGFAGLDALLDGGLYAGLYFLGAITSLGKTTFVLQVADQIAAAGHDVLYFSLEMAQSELIAKSISRLTFLQAREKGLPPAKAKTTRGILAGKRWSSYSREEMELIASAADIYKDSMSGHIWYHEGVGDIGVAQIREEVEEHIAITGNKPVVFIDYVQILAPVDIRASDKQNVDRNVLELKRLSRDMDIPVVGVSSLNRDNYTSPINNAAFKESGAIEYGCDALIGLQFEGMDFQDGEAEKAREKRIRELFKEQKARGNEGGAEDIQLKILKNRNGKSGTEARFSYYPMFNTYEEKGGMTQSGGTDAARVFGSARRV